MIIGSDKMGKGKEKPYKGMFVDFGLDYSVLDVLNSNKKVGVFQTCAGHKFGETQIGHIGKLWGEKILPTTYPEISFTYKGRLPHSKIYNYLKKLPNTRVYARGILGGEVAFDLMPLKIQGNNKRWWDMVSKAVAKIK